MASVSPVAGAVDEIYSVIRYLYIYILWNAQSVEFHFYFLFKLHLNRSNYSKLRMEQAFQYHTEAAKDNKQGVYAKHAGETEAHELNVKYSAIEWSSVWLWENVTYHCRDLHWKMLRTILRVGDDWCWWRPWMTLNWDRVTFNIKEFDLLPSQF